MSADPKDALIAELANALQNMVHALDAAQSDMADIFAPKIARNRQTAVDLIARATASVGGADGYPVAVEARDGEGSAPHALPGVGK